MLLSMKLKICFTLFVTLSKDGTGDKCLSKKAKIGLGIATGVLVLVIGLVVGLVFSDKSDDSIVNTTPTVTSPMTRDKIF